MTTNSHLGGGQIGPSRLVAVVFLSIHMVVAVQQALFSYFLDFSGSSSGGYVVGRGLMWVVMGFVGSAVLRKLGWTYFALFVVVEAVLFGYAVYLGSP